MCRTSIVIADEEEVVDENAMETERLVSRGVDENRDAECDCGQPDCAACWERGSDGAVLDTHFDAYFLRQWCGLYDAWVGDPEPGDGGERDEDGTEDAEAAAGDTGGHRESTAETSSIPPFDLGEAEYPLHDRSTWSMNGGVLMGNRNGDTTAKASSIPPLDIGEAESSSPLEHAWSLGGGKLRK